MSRFTYAVIACSYFVLSPAWAGVVGDVGITEPKCQADLTRPVRVQKISVPFADDVERMIALTAVIPDFDPERDLAIGIRPGGHTYLINAQIGRFDPQMFGGRSRFHENEKLNRLKVNPGLVIRLRLSAPLVDRVAVEMSRLRNARSWTCTNTTARILARADVPAMHALIFTPRQLSRKIGCSPDLGSEFYLVNSDADGVEDFEDRVKVIGAKKATPPATDAPRPRQAAGGCSDEGDSCDCCMSTLFNLDWFTGSSQSGESACSESGCSESGCCESSGSESECSEFDSDCCN